jgi:hypothetical protein
MLRVEEMQDGMFVWSDKTQPRDESGISGEKLFAARIES